MKSKTKSAISAALAVVTAVMFTFPLVACNGDPVYTEDGSKVVFDYNDGKSRPMSVIADENEKIEEPAEPMRKGYGFVGWYTDKTEGEKVVFPLAVDKDVTLYARWDVMSYSVTFNMNHDGAPENIVQKISYGQEVSPPDDPVMNGFTFYRWEVSSTESAEVVFPYKVTGNVSFYARWVTSLFKITFDNNYEGAETGTLQIPGGNKINNGDWANPTRPGYDFKGWGTTPDATAGVTFPYEPTGDGTLYAIWKKAQYTVNFRNNYIDAPTNFKSVKVDGGTAMDKPTDEPVREGFTFEGWYTSAKGGEPIVFPYTPAKTTAIYAHWKSVAVQTTVFDAEYTEINPSEIFPGYSGSATGAQIIQEDSTGNGHANSEDYPFTSKKPAPKKGHFVTYLYKKNATLRFVIYSDKAVSGVKLKLRLGYEILNTGSLTIGPTGKYAYGVVVNGSSLDYAPITITGSDISGGGMFMSSFADYDVSIAISLKEGENVIELVTLNETPELAGTTGAVAPMVDCIKLDNLGGATLHWYPVYDNLYI